MGRGLANVIRARKKSPTSLNALKIAFSAGGAFLFLEARTGIEPV
jgi:hypothetical protein